MFIDLRDKLCVKKEIKILFPNLFNKTILADLYSYLYLLSENFSMEMARYALVQKQL